MNGKIFKDLNKEKGMRKLKAVFLSVLFIVSLFSGFILN